MNHAGAAAAEPDLERYLRERRFARECAVQFLYRCDQQQDWECRPAALADFRAQLEQRQDCPADPEFTRSWEFAVRLIHGACSEREAVDRMLTACADNWSLERMAMVDRNILRLAAYELMFSERVPQLAAINEAIELAKLFGHRESSRFVNGVLDRILRQLPCGSGETEEPAP